MHKFISLIISVTIITLIIFIAKSSGHAINFNSDDFYLNLVTEVIGITLTVMLIEIFGSKILRYIENRKNKTFNKYLNKRLSLIINRLNQKFILINVNINAEFNTVDNLVQSISLNYLNGTETRGYYLNNQFTSMTFPRPILFYNEFQNLLKEIEIVSKQLPQGLPNEIYEGMIMILSHDTYMWDILNSPVTNYNAAWLDNYKELIYDKYLGARKLIEGKRQLEELVK